MNKKQKDFLIAWFFIMLALTAFWGTVWYFGWLEEVLAFLIVVLACIFAWESTLIVDEQKRARRKNGR